MANVNHLKALPVTYPLVAFLHFNDERVNPRNPSAINPYADMEYCVNGYSRLIFRRTRAKHAVQHISNEQHISVGQGEHALQVLGGWELDADVEAILSKGWEPDNSFSIYS